MKRLFISTTILALLLASQLALAADEDDLIAANQNLFYAWDCLDSETLASLLAEGKVIIGFESPFPGAPMENTQVEPSEYLNIPIESFSYIFMSPYNIRCKVFENTGIVWGYVSVISEGKGGRQAWYLRYISTWIKSDGRWRIVMNHYSIIP